MSGCRTCGGYGMNHDPVVHGWVTECEHIWSQITDDDPNECLACGAIWEAE